MESENKNLSIADIGYKSPSTKVANTDIAKNEKVITNKKTDETVIVEENSFTEIAKTGIYNQYIWIFLIASIVAIVLCIFIAMPGAVWFSGLKKYAWSENLWVWMILFIVVVLIMGICTFLGFVKAQCIEDSISQGVIFMSFVASLLTMIIWFSIFFRSKDIQTAFYLLIVLLFLAFLQIYFVWKMNDGAGWGIVPWIVFLIFLIAAVWEINTENDDCF